MMNGSMIVMLEQAAAQGNPQALMYLGMIYLTGEGSSIPADTKKAVQYLDRLAQLSDDAVVHFTIGAVYVGGQGNVPKDIVKAVQYFEKAAQGGHAEAMYNLATIYHHGDGSIAANISKAVGYYEGAAKGGNVNAMFHLAVMYLQGTDGIAVNVKKGIKYMEKAANGGNLNAMFNLALIYTNGLGETVSADIQKAVQYYEKAAAGGSAQAMYNLGVLYMNGFGSIPADVRKAVKYYEGAVAKGYIQAVRNLAVIYENGQGNVSADINTALQYYEFLVKGGDTDAMVSLGSIYGTGKGGVTVDMAKAMKYLEEAGERGNTKGFHNIAVYYHHGQDSIAVDMEKAVQYYSKAAEGGSAESMFNLGLIYYDGLNGVTADLDKAVHYYEKAAERENAEAIYNLGALYRYGKGCIGVDTVKAVQYYEKAAVRGGKGSKQALYSLADIYRVGTDGVPQDVQKAVLYYERSAEGGNVNAVYLLGAIYQSGCGSVSADIVKAMQYYERAAECGMVYAMHNLGVIYQQGHGSLVVQDVEKARQYFEQAAERGCTDALYNLGWNYENGLHGVERDTERAREYYERALHSWGIDTVGASADIAFKHILQYRLGKMLIALDRVDEARDVFDTAVRETDSAYGYLGLAGLTAVDDVDAKIHYLTRAAECGAAEGWGQLMPYVDHEALHRHWSVDNIAMLRALVLSISDSETRKVQCARVRRHTTCGLCRQEQTYMLAAGVNREVLDTPCSHIAESVLERVTERAIGSGGQGGVILGRLHSLSPSQSVVVALKRALDVSSTLQAFIEREFRLLQLLSQCDYVVQTHGHTLLDGEYYIVMEASRYGSLRSVMLHSDVSAYLGSERGLSLLLRWMHDVAQGVQYMHNRYMRHGDLKPDNVLVFDGLHVKVADFGQTNKSLDGDNSARLLGLVSGETERETESRVTNSLTRSNAGSCCGGTVGYQPPEQLSNDRLTLESDMFSYGATWIHVINGRSHGYAFGPALRQAEEECIRRYEGQWPTEVRDMLVLLRRCLSVNKEDRPTASECVQVLGRLCESITCSEEEIGDVTRCIDKLYA